MRIADYAVSYATVALAEARLKKAAEQNGMTIDSLDWLIIVNAAGRYIPAIFARPTVLSNVGYWISKNIAVIG